MIREIKESKEQGTYEDIVGRYIEYRNIVKNSNDVFSFDVYLNTKAGKFVVEDRAEITKEDLEDYLDNGELIMWPGLIDVAALSGTKVPNKLMHNGKIDDEAVFDLLPEEAWTEVDDKLVDMILGAGTDSERIKEAVENHYNDIVGKTIEYRNISKDGNYITFDVFVKMYGGLRIDSRAEVTEEDLRDYLDNGELILFQDTFLGVTPSDISKVPTNMVVDGQVNEDDLFEAIPEEAWEEVDKQLVSMFLESDDGKDAQDIYVKAMEVQAFIENNGSKIGHKTKEDTYELKDEMNHIVSVLKKYYRG